VDDLQLSWYIFCSCKLFIIMYVAYQVNVLMDKCLLSKLSQSVSGMCVLNGNAYV